MLRRLPSKNQNQSPSPQSQKFRQWRKWVGRSEWGAIPQSSPRRRPPDARRSRTRGRTGPPSWWSCAPCSALWPSTDLAHAVHTGSRSTVVATWCCGGETPSTELWARPEAPGLNCLRTRNVAGGGAQGLQRLAEGLIPGNVPRTGLSLTNLWNIITDHQNLFPWKAIFFTSYEKSYTVYYFQYFDTSQQLLINKRKGKKKSSHFSKTPKTTWAAA